MGEFVVISDDRGGGGGGAATELGIQETEGVELLTAPGQRKAEEGNESPSATAAESWEVLLPKMVFKVLLVESDDSTRQIIAALLRKCSFKVGDGLKAWEVLKKRPRNVDLILTEVDLPSISGYALLTLIMEHELCKNIPVIMMSARDSISTVYKCMLRGAADFLVKPVRKNELRNLWQHVWRRQASSKREEGQADESVVQQKFEATAENDGFNNDSSGFKACNERNKDCIQKGSDDAQSSCTKPEIQEPHPIPSGIQLRNPENQVSGEDRSSYENNPTILELPKQATSLVGPFDNHPNCNYISSSPSLDLSLTRHTSGSINQLSDERHRLKLSDASAFTRYVSKGVHPRDLRSPNTLNQQRGDDDHNSDTQGPTKSFQCLIQRADIESGQGGETALPSPTGTVFSVPIPVRTVTFDSLSNTYSFMAYPFHCLNHQSIHSQQCNGLTNQNVSSVTTQANYQQGFHSEPERAHVSSTTDQSANNGNGVMNCHYTAVDSKSECRNEEASVAQDRNSQKLQRQAALDKFRLKRKDRCFEKKVRYESRKKLAEQRPRVKGQFVRHLPSEPPPGDT
ncbi:unnamed protein product [Cuscuta europaea]|uniref:Two-component response regulator-like APRR5 n=1 Tax=Cuscuta europaea TaxID=41803 RepID=A0A9P0ZQB8_CUSEU|nr:unnamed protein product [Cuscuta europaea]